MILPEEYIGEVKSKHHSVLDGHKPLTNEFIGDYGWWPLFEANRVTPATIQEHMVNRMSNSPNNATSLLGQTHTTSQSST